MCSSDLGGGAGRSWEELGGTGRSWEELGGVGRKSWEELGGVGRSWEELRGYPTLTAGRECKVPLPAAPPCSHQVAVLHRRHREQQQGHHSLRHSRVDCMLDCIVDYSGLYAGLVWTIHWTRVDYNLN